MTKQHAQDKNNRSRKSLQYQIWDSGHEIHTTTGHAKAPVTATQYETLLSNTRKQRKALPSMALIFFYSCEDINKSYRRVLPTDPQFLANWLVASSSVLWMASILTHRLEPLLGISYSCFLQTEVQILEVLHPPLFCTRNTICHRLR